LDGTVQRAGPSSEGVAVIIFPVEQDQWTGYGFQPPRIRSTLTTPGGAFSVSDLPAGDYFAVAVPNSAQASWKNPELLRGLSKGASRVKLSWGQVETTQLQAPR